MLKLMKYIKKFWAPILFCVALLFGQSQAELSLPDLMSDIVSVGIQAGGFDGAVSDVLTTETFDHLLVLMDDDDQKIMKDSYELVEAGKVDSDIKSSFPESKNQDVYVLKDLSSEEMDTLNDALTKPMLIVTSIDKMDPNSEEYKERFKDLPEGITIYQVLGTMTFEQKEEMFKEIDTQIESMGESTLSIAAGNGVKAEYERLGADTEDVQMSYIIGVGLKMLGIALLGSVAAIIVSLLSSRIGAGLARDVRKDVFAKVESFSNDEFNKFSTASLITRTTNDITQVQNVMTMVLRIVCFAPMMGIGALIKAINNSPSMTWIIALVLVVMLCVIGVAFVVVLPKFKVIQELIDKLNLTMRENLSGMLVIRAFGNEKYSENRFNNANDDLTKVNLFVNRAMASIMPIMMFMFNVVSVLIIWFGAKQVDLGNIDIGQMMAFIQYAMNIIMSFLMIAMISIMLPRASVAAERIFEVLSTEPQILDPTTPKAFIESKKGLLEFKNVTFK
ncbi:MAG: ABC transporter permease, partial [Coprobacillaceae bacterium]